MNNLVTAAVRQFAS